jgi:acetaldehyde dehydrogenase
MTTPVAIIGSGNIGTDLMFKIKRLSATLRVAAMAGVDAGSDGLARARRMGIAITHEGVDGLVALPEFEDVAVVFDGTSAAAHRGNYERVRPYGKIMIDLTPAAIGPYVVPTVNLDEHLAADNINMVTCTETTAAAIERVGGAERGKAVIVLNPAEPPLVMRDTIFCLVEGLGRAERDAVDASVAAMVAEVQTYVPGYRLKQAVQYDEVMDDFVPALGRPFKGTKVSVFLEVTEAGHYLPACAGNLDIMTSAALRTAERIVARRAEAVPA